MEDQQPKKGGSTRDIGVYVHFPWCLQKCPYCDFATRPIDRPSIPHAAYADAVIRELASRAESIADARLTSVFFGGGTPSLWDPIALGRVLASIQAAFQARAPYVEITVECNPSSLDDARARALIDVGVNRLSVGIQSLDDARLRFLGRLHDRDQGLRAVESAVRAAPRASADMIFGSPGQRAEDAAAELEILLATGVSHVSAYSLTIETGTRFGELHKKGKLPIALEDDVADSFLALRETCARRGFGHYEISNYAQRDQESLHNMHYWRGGEYLGLGAAAVGRIGSRRYRNQPDPTRYQAGVDTGQAEESEERLSSRDHVHESLMLGLRTREGVDLERLGREAGDEEVQRIRAAIDRGVSRGELICEGDRFLRVPPSRWLGLDAIVLAFF